jgi:DNA-binding transcriptional MerR regulator
MEYTVQKLGYLAGVSTRTLRYYDVIGILKPARINSSGYRIYGQSEVDRLQQILFYRELGVSLEGIKDMMIAPAFDGQAALREHHEKLLEKHEQLNTLIANVEKTIALTEGKITMTNKEKFEGFKQKMLDENEAKYGQEIRAKYGDATIEKSNNKFKNMTEEQHAEIEKLGADVIDAIATALATGDPAGELAQKAADLHRQWLSFYWDTYDERFTAYYDVKQPGSAVFLRDAVLIYTGMKS